MEKYFAYALGILLLLTPSLRADTVVSDGSPDSFQDALDTTIALGGGTITVTTPIVIGSDDSADDEEFDGGTNIVVSGGGANSIFLVQNGSLTLTGLTLQNGLSTNGGAIYITVDGSLTASNCIFQGNVAQGDDGISTGTNSDDGSDDTGDLAFARLSKKTNSPPATPATPGFPGLGGAIYSLGDATILNCQFVTNSAIGGTGGTAGTGGGNQGAGGNGGGAIGGGIYSEGTLDIENSTFSGNLATGGDGGGNTGLFGSGGIGGFAEGAGLYSADADDTITISACTFSQNVALGGVSGNGGVSAAGIGRAGRNGGSAFGGGINNVGAMALTNCTFFQNSAIGGTGGTGADGGGRGGGGGSGGRAIGGGFYNTGMVSVVSCTFSKGSAVGGTNGLGGAGIVNGKSGKRGSGQGGNIANVAKKKSGNTFFLMTSIIATNLAGGGGFGPIVDGGYNLSADKTIKLKAVGSKAKTNPLIGDLAQNGGPTETITLSPNSPAIDKIPIDLAPPFDQRGNRRPEPTNGLSDIGSFELDTNSAQIFTQPDNTTVSVGSNVTFTASAIGTPPLVFQWIFNGAPATITNVPNALNGFTNATLTITNAQLTNMGAFQLIVTNNFNSATSQVAQLTVVPITNNAPFIITQPVGQTVTNGATVTFTVTAGGTTPLFYQWFYKGVTFVFTNIPNATNSVLTLTNVQLTNNQGDYAVVVTNNFGSTNSNPATLLINTNTSTGGGGLPPPPGANSILANSEGQAPRLPQLVPLTVEQNGDGPPMIPFAFPSEAEVPYVIEYKQSLTDPVWTPILTNLGTGNWLTNRLPATNQPAGFYRVRSQ